MTTKQAGFSFGPFLLRGPYGPLTRDGVPVSLQRKTLALLYELVNQAGEVVTRKMLLDTVWPGVIVSANAVDYQIRLLRNALGDSAHDPRYVRTVHGVGFSFVATVGKVYAVPAETLAQPAIPINWFSGRARELAALDTALAQALGGKRRTVVVKGEAGIGKSALARTFLQSVQATPLVSVVCRCMPDLARNDTLRPLLQALAGICASDASGRVTGVLRRHAPTVLVQLPDMLSDAEYEALRPAAANAPPDRVLAELVDALEMLASTQPLLLIVEDLHCSDHSTRSALSMLMRRQNASRILALVTGRLNTPADYDDSDGGWLCTFDEATGVTEIELQCLSRNAVELYAYRRFGLGWDHALTERLFVGSGGHPMLMAHLADHLLESSGDAGLQDTDGIPERLRMIIDLRLDQLTAAARELLECAAVVGIDFCDAEIATAMDMPLAVVEAECGELVRQSRLIAAAGTVRWPDGTVSVRYGFCHTLYHRALRQRVPLLRLSQVQERLALGKEIAYGNRTADIAADLARRFEAADLPNKATQYHLLAARTAQERASHLDSVAHTTAGLALLKLLSDGHDRDNLELGLLLCLMGSATLAGGVAEERIRAANKRIDELSLTTNKPALQAQALVHQWAQHHVQGQHRKALAYAENQRSVGASQRNTVWEAAGLSRASVSLHLLAEHRASEQHSSQALALLRDARHTSTRDTRAPPTVVATIARSLTSWSRGFPDTSLDLAHEAIAHAQAAANPVAQCVARALGLPVALFYRRESAKLLEACDRAMALCQRFDYREGLMYASQFRAIALCQSGYGEQGLPELRRVITKRRSLGYFCTLTMALASEAEYCISTLRFDEGQTALDAAALAVEHQDERVWEAEIRRLQGNLYWARGDSADAALQAYQEAQNIAREQDALSLQLRAAVHSTQLLRKLGRNDPPELRTLYDQFTEGVATPDMRNAAALLQMG